MSDAPAATAQPVTVEILGARWPLIRPCFATIEEVGQAALRACQEVAQVGGQGRFYRTYAAVLGVTTQLGDKAGANWERAQCNPLVFGGQVYSYLREKGATADQIATAAQPVVVWLLAEAFPREAAIKAQENFTGAGGGASTP